MPETWMQTDYRTEGVLALEMTVEQLRKVLDDPYRWKWVILAAHNALHSFLVAAISGSDLLGAMTEKYAAHWRERYERGVRPTMAERLADFPELLRRAEGLKGYVDSSPLRPSDEERASAERLNRWRSDFIHYKPGSMSIEVSGFPKIIGDALSLAEHLALRSGHVFRGQDEFSERTEAALREAREFLEEIARGYDP
jgi:hypothetical protein